MCIRDSDETAIRNSVSAVGEDTAICRDIVSKLAIRNRCVCLLYTSDAADERSSVDLGGRRIIKKKKITTTVDRRKQLSTQEQHYVITKLRSHKPHIE